MNDEEENNDNEMYNLALYLRFEIHDHGIGLSEEAMKHLFNPFKQAQRLAGGTGKYKVSCYPLFYTLHVLLSYRIGTLFFS